MENIRIFDKKNNMFVTEMTDDKDRYITSEGTGVFVTKTKTQMLREKELIISAKEIELGRELTPQEKKKIKVSNEVEIFTGDILGDAYGALYYIDYCPRCKSFEPFSIDGCLACRGYVKLIEIDFPSLHIIGNIFQDKKLLYLNF